MRLTHWKRLKNRLKNHLMCIGLFWSMMTLWALPTMTVESGQGDCEDGAFLIKRIPRSSAAGLPFL
jgi:hypothetical protein